MSDNQDWDETVYKLQGTLKPCPFCGGQPSISPGYICCHSCGCEGPLGSNQETEEGARLWNARHSLIKDQGEES